MLDWLAVEFVKQGWSLKKMHRLIVHQRDLPAIVAGDAGTAGEAIPTIALLARGPRVRLEAELVRDAVLRAQRAAVARRSAGRASFRRSRRASRRKAPTAQLQWKVSAGEDRYRRGLYTFSKRTAPFAMFTTFDAPSGEACLARREVSNTPLQALTLLNDAVFVEAAQALGRHAGGAARRRSTSASTYLFRRCLTRPPTAEETAQLVTFYQTQKRRFERKELDAAHDRRRRRRRRRRAGRVDGRWPASCSTSMKPITKD